MIFDAVLAYQFIKKLVTPFNQMPAYKLHLIDDKGNFLKTYTQFTTQEKNACGLFDIMIINLKKLIAKLPGGSSRIGTVAAAMVLLNSKPIRENVEDFNEDELKNEFYDVLEQLQFFYEDAAPAAAPPVNSAGSGDIAGIGQPPGSAKGFPPVSINNKYKKKNMEYTKKLKRALGEAESHDIEKVFRDDYKKKNAGQEVKLNKITKIVKKFSRFKEETSLQYHETLNPKIWDNGRLKEEVRGKLLQIAEAWRAFAKIDPEKIQDIILTGGNANYNYTPQSDLDLHLVIDRSSMATVDRAFIDEYLQDKKILWTLTHSDIRIYGYPVELYAQDVNELPHTNQGVYSVLHDDWIQVPSHLNINFENDALLQKKVLFYKKMIDKLINQKADQDAIDTLKDKLKNLRSDSIAKGGEFAFGNLVFKDLRNSGYLDKISDYQRTSKDKALSLE
jgi:hypothetical protein